MARYSVVFVFYCTQNVKIDLLKFNLLPNEPIESFWDALWLELWTLLCSIVESHADAFTPSAASVPGVWFVWGGWQVPRICTCVEMGDMWGRAALSSGRVTCDTCGPFLVSGPVWE